MKAIKNVCILFWIFVAIVCFTNGGVWFGVFFLGIAFLNWKYMSAKTAKSDRKKYLAATGAIETFEGAHVSGLPIGPALGRVSFFRDRMVITGDGSEFVINIDKIKNIYITKKDADMRRGGTVQQAPLLGNMNSMAGRELGNFVYRIVYLNIDYINKENVVDTICFNVSAIRIGKFDLEQASVPDLQKRCKNAVSLLSQREMERVVL